MLRPSYLALDASKVRLLQQVLPQKFYARVELEILVALFAEAMTFILGHDVPDGRARLLQRRHHLLRFAHRHARIVLTGHDNHRLADLFDVVHRRDFFEVLAHLGSRSSPYSTRRKSRRYASVCS